MRPGEIAQRSVAYDHGHADGVAMAHARPEERLLEGSPDEVLIRALKPPRLYEVLGLSQGQGDERGEAWRAALREYSAGFKRGVLEILRVSGHSG